MDITDQPDSIDDVKEGTDALSTSPSPGDLAAMAKHDQDGEPLDEFPVSSEGAPSGFTGLVVGEPASPDR